MSKKALLCLAAALLVPPVSQKVVTDEPVRFSPDVFNQQLGVLPQCEGNHQARMGVAGVLVPGTLTLKSKPGKKGAVLSPSKDYTLTESTGALRIAPGSTIHPNDTVYATYKVQQQRADSVVETEKGVRKLVVGTPANWSPQPPSGSEIVGRVAIPGTPVENIYSNSQSKNVEHYPIKTGPFDPRPEAAANAKFLQGTFKKLSSGQPVKIVFWGDSITLGSGASTDKKTYVIRVLQGLQIRYPSARISYKNSAVGGGAAAVRMGSFDKDVIAEKPDLVMIEYVNDALAPVRGVHENFPNAIERARKAGAEVLLIIPHIPSPTLIPANGKNNTGIVPYFAFLRSLKPTVATVDIAAHYEHLAGEGIKPETFCVDGIHPCDWGHKIYADQILATLRGAK